MKKAIGYCRVSTLRRPARNFIRHAGSKIKQYAELNELELIDIFF